MEIKVLCHFPAGDLKFATSNLQDIAGNWQNKIINISSLNRNIGEDKSYEISGISIEFNDTDRYFRHMMTSSNRYIAGKKVELYTKEDQLIYTGTVEKWQFGEDSWTLIINDKLSGLDILVPESIAIDVFPQCVEEAEGQSIPVIYGTLEQEGGTVKCWKVKETGDKDLETYQAYYLLARHHCKQLIGDQAYQEDGTIIDDATLMNDIDYGYAYIVTTTDENFIYVNVQGKYDSSSELIQDPIDALKDLIDCYTDMTYNVTSMDIAQSLMVDRGYTIAAVIQEQQNLNDVLVDFCFSFDCDFHIGKGSEIEITLLNRATLSPIRSFSSHQIIDFNMEELPEKIRNKVKYMYRYNFATEQYVKTPIYSKESSIANWGEFYNRNESLELRYLSDDDSAWDVVQRYLIQRKNPKRIANATIPLTEFSGIDIGDIVEIQHPNAIDDNKRKYQVRRIDIDFLSDTAKVEVIDITSLTGGILILGDSTQLPITWTGESEGNIHREYGYLADGVTGYFSNNSDFGKVLY